MAVVPLNDPATATAALNAFLRGVERRGAVFAHWQGGEVEAGDLALAATLRGFREVAGSAPFAEWPRRFWAMLLASPQLRTPARAGACAGVPAHVSGLGSGPRAALLLRLVAGLAEADAAAVLGIARPTYRLALQRALPRRGDGDADPEAWRELSAVATQAVRAVSAERLQGIASLRDGQRARRRPSDAGGAGRQPVRRWPWPAAVFVVLATAAALAATWWWPGAGADGQAARIRIEPLPPPPPPAARFDPAAVLETHRDLDLLVAQATGEFPEDADPAFDAWLVVALEQGDADPDPAVDATGHAASPEQSDAPR